MVNCCGCIYNAQVLCTLGINRDGEECLSKDTTSLKMIRKPIGNRYEFFSLYRREQIPKGYRGVTIHYEVDRKRLPSKWREIKVKWVVKIKPNNLGGSNVTAMITRIKDYLYLNYSRFSTRNIHFTYKHLRRGLEGNREYSMVEMCFYVEIKKYQSPIELPAI